MLTLRGESPAKINLTLRVVCKRPDGYHEIESLIGQVDLCDTVTVSGTADTESEPAAAVRVACSDPSIPTGESNLATRAARAILRVGGDSDGGKASVAGGSVSAFGGGLAIDLLKRIPAGAGLGGGSSNAATVLRLADELLGLKLPRQRLAELGAELGADVPLFLGDSPCIVRGIGHEIETGLRPIRGWATIVMPPILCDTREVYEAWSRCPHVAKRSSATRLSTLYRTAGELMPRLYNDLEPAAMLVRPELARIHEDVSKLAGAPVRMTGSGSALFRLYDEERDARVLAEQVERVLGMPVATVGLRWGESSLKR